MGTSTSSRGAPSCVSFDPPWLTSVASQIESTVASIAGASACSSSARFRASRLSLSKYIKSGAKSKLAASLGHYVKHGLGGAKQATSRMQIPVAASVALWSSLNDLINKDDDSEDWVDRVLSSEDKLGALEEELVKKILPEGGSVDEESCRRSLVFAISEFIRENPDVDILNLESINLFGIMELFLTQEIFNRYYLDIGQKLEQADISEIVGLEKEIKRYIRSTLSVEMSKKIKNGISLTKKVMVRLIADIITETFEVFEEAVDD